MAKTILIFLICNGTNSRFCEWEPIYAIKFETEVQCSIASQKIPNTASKRVYCIPEIKEK